MAEVIGKKDGILPRKCINRANSYLKKKLSIIYQNSN